MGRQKSLESYYHRVGNRLLDGYGRDVMAAAEKNAFSVILTAEALGLKPFQLSMRIEAATGMSPKDYFRLHRAFLAKRYILEEEPLESISERLGFRHYTHFAAEIRAFYNCCPRDLRAILQKISRRPENAEESPTQEQILHSPPLPVPPPVPLARPINELLGKLYARTTKARPKLASV